MKIKEYAIYKGDDFLFVGTLSECAKYRNCKKKNIIDLIYLTKKRKNIKRINRIEIIAV